MQGLATELAAVRNSVGKLNSRLETGITVLFFVSASFN